MAKLSKRTGFIGTSGTLSMAPDVAQSLGELTAAWSFLEHQFTLLLERAAGISFENASAILYAVNATSARIDIVRTVLERFPADNPLRKDGCDALREAVALCGRRNALVHHSWIVDAFTGKVFTFDYRAEPDTQSRRTRRTAKAIYRFCEEVTAVAQLFFPLTNYQWADTREEALRLYEESQKQPGAQRDPHYGSVPVGAKKRKPQLRS